ncbi:MAG: MBL fold metallo-hydrolase [Alphaproteobacteria bacterium]|nr:MBL fold metallo-hydrolase [Alphaproteobacteria bacterium]
MPLQIYPVLCRAGKMDNYSYVLVDDATGTTAVIDPSEAAPIIAELERLDHAPDYILNTHHHFDHTDDNLTLKEKYGAKVVANEQDKNRIPGFDIGVRPGETFMFGDSAAQIIDASAHTQGIFCGIFRKPKPCSPATRCLTCASAACLRERPNKCFRLCKK